MAGREAVATTGARRLRAGGQRDGRAWAPDSPWTPLWWVVVRGDAWR